MTRNHIKKAVAEAERFIARAVAVDVMYADVRNHNEDLWGYNKRTAAMKRASMDLTRALAVLRGRATK